MFFMEYQIDYPSKVNNSSWDKFEPKFSDDLKPL